MEEERRRPPWLALLSGGALAFTALVGLLSESYGDKAARADQAASDDDEVRRDLARMGWRGPTVPIVAAMAVELEVVRGVELLEARAAFRLELGHGVVRGEPPRAAAAAAAAAVVVEEVRRLPAAFLAAAALHRIVLCEDLREDVRAIPSLPNYRHTLLLDVGAPPGFLRRLIHHEIFHFVDLADDGTVHRDPTWEALNPPGFVYGHGGRSMRDPAASEPDPTLTGFVTRYAQAALEEDKAEVFAFMMTAPEALRRRAARDGVLAAKIDRVRELTAAISATTDADFWRRVERAP